MASMGLLIMVLVGVVGATLFLYGLWQFSGAADTQKLIDKTQKQIEETQADIDRFDAAKTPAEKKDAAIAGDLTTCVDDYSSALMDACDKAIMNDYKWCQDNGSNSVSYCADQRLSAYLKSHGLV